MHLMWNKEIRVTSRKNIGEEQKKYIGHQEPNINAKFHNLEKKKP